MRSCLVCDDHALVREALSGAVRLAWPNAVVKEAGNFPDAWREARNEHDVCIADLVMPGADPIAGISGLVQAAPDLRILIVTGTTDDALMMALLDLGVAGFAPKTSNGSLIEAALRLILAGGRYLPPRIAEIAASRHHGSPKPAPTAPSIAIRNPLSDRQLEVLRLVAQGLSNKEIARRLDLAPSTVKSHLMAAMLCFESSNRIDAVNKARAMLLI